MGVSLNLRGFGHLCIGGGNGAWQGDLGVFQGLTRP